jgi:hypothetical protein
MTLQHFYNALNVRYEGECTEIKSSENASLVAFWDAISVDGPTTINRGKLNTIQHPGLCYFATFLTRGFLARDNLSACSRSIIYLLRCAAMNIEPTYNLGAMVARSLSLACSHNSASRLYCGGIATLVRNYIQDSRLFRVVELKDAARGSNMLTPKTLARLDMLHYATAESILHKFMVRRNSFVAILLPREDFFQREDAWKETEEQIRSGFHLES